MNWRNLLNGLKIAISGLYIGIIIAKCIHGLNVHPLEWLFYGFFCVILFNSIADIMEDGDKDEEV